MTLDFSSTEGHQLHLQEPKDAIAVTDGIEVFSVPRKYVGAILKAVPELRYSFEHVGGQHHARAKKFTENTNYATAPWEPSLSE